MSPWCRMVEYWPGWMCVGIGLAVGGAALPSVAWADPPASVSDDGAAQSAAHVSNVDASAEVKAWSRNTSRERRIAARAIFLEANRHLRIPNFRRAAEKYREAITMWPHPAFHYNLAITQLNLVQPIEAWHSLQAALAYGAEPLGEDKHAIALEYLALLDKQLGRVVIESREPAAEVILDGKQVVLDAGKQAIEVVVMPGEHLLVARKPGRVTQTERVIVSAGEHMRVAVVLLVPGRVATRRYVAAWLPWTGLASGVVLLTVAGVLDWDSAHTIDAVDREFMARCLGRACNKEALAKLDGAERERSAALGLYVVGGLVVAGSAVLVYLNRERVVTGEAKALATGHVGGRVVSGVRRVTIIPLVSPTWMGAAATLRF